MPLKIIIVGAGLGGLAAALAFTKAGHHVEVYEKSSFLHEVGAAIHLAPNATRALKPWALDFEAMNSTPCEHFSFWDHKGDFLSTLVVTKQLQETLGIDDPWLLVHRVDLHNALRKKAAEGFDGRKPNIHLSCAVSSVDPSTGKVILEDGRVLQADLIIGADGLHSRTVASVMGEAQKKKSTGQNCFRFLVPTEKIYANPTTKQLIERIDLQSINAFIASERRLVFYPCRGGTLINAVVFCPDDPDNETAELSWQNSGSRDDLMAQMEGFGSELRELCSMAEDVRLWSLASRDPPEIFYKEKLVLVGDAAHPTLPHQGQGGAQAFEDAAALGALFTADTRAEQIGERLKLYNDIRYKQAVMVFFMSRVGHDRREGVMEDLRRFVPKAEMPKNIFADMWASSPAKEAERALTQIDQVGSVKVA